MDQVPMRPQHRVGQARVAAVAGACAVALALAACGAGDGSSSGAASQSPPASGSATPAPAPAALTLTEAQNGATVHVARGQMIVLVLHSTYWKVVGSSDPAVVQPSGGSQVQPSPGCVPGQGCGTVTTTFVAAADGSAMLTASRTTCGEALRCTEAQARFSVTVAVAG